MRYILISLILPSAIQLSDKCTLLEGYFAESYSSVNQYYMLPYLIYKRNTIHLYPFIHFLPLKQRI